MASTVSVPQAAQMCEPSMPPSPPPLASNRAARQSEVSRGRPAMGPLPLGEAVASVARWSQVLAVGAESRLVHWQQPCATRCSKDARPPFSRDRLAFVDSSLQALDALLAEAWWVASHAPVAVAPAFVNAIMVGARAVLLNPDPYAAFPTLSAGALGVLENCLCVHPEEVTTACASVEEGVELLRATMNLLRSHMGCLDVVMPAVAVVKRLLLRAESHGALTPQVMVLAKSRALVLFGAVCAHATHPQVQVDGMRALLILAEHDGTGIGTALGFLPGPCVANVLGYAQTLVNESADVDLNSVVARLLLAFMPDNGWIGEDGGMGELVSGGEQAAEGRFVPSCARAAVMATRILQNCFVDANAGVVQADATEAWSSTCRCAVEAFVRAVAVEIARWDGMPRPTSGDLPDPVRALVEDVLVAVEVTCTATLAPYLWKEAEVLRAVLQTQVDAGCVPCSLPDATDDAARMDEASFPAMTAATLLDELTRVRADGTASSLRDQLFLRWAMPLATARADLVCGAVAQAGALLVQLVQAWEPLARAGSRQTWDASGGSCALLVAFGMVRAARSALVQRLPEVDDEALHACLSALVAGAVGILRAWDAFVHDTLLCEAALDALLGCSTMYQGLGVWLATDSAERRTCIVGSLEIGLRAGATVALVAKALMAAVAVAVACQSDLRQLLWQRAHLLVVAVQAHSAPVVQSSAMWLLSRAFGQVPRDQRAANVWAAEPPPQVDPAALAEHAAMLLCHGAANVAVCGSACSLLDALLRSEACGHVDDTAVLTLSQCAAVVQGQLRRLAALPVGTRYTAPADAEGESRGAFAHTVVAWAQVAVDATHIFVHAVASRLGAHPMRPRVTDATVQALMLHSGQLLATVRSCSNSDRGVGEQPAAAYALIEGMLKQARADVSAACEQAVPVDAPGVCPAPAATPAALAAEPALVLPSVGAGTEAAGCAEATRAVIRTYFDALIATAKLAGTRPADGRAELCARLSASEMNAVAVIRSGQLTVELALEYLPRVLQEPVRVLCAVDAYHGDADVCARAIRAVGEWLAGMSLARVRQYGSERSREMIRTRVHVAAAFLPSMHTPRDVLDATLRLLDAHGSGLAFASAAFRVVHVLAELAGDEAFEVMQPHVPTLVRIMRAHITPPEARWVDPLEAVRVDQAAKATKATKTAKAAAKAARVRARADSKAIQMHGLCVLFEMSGGGARRGGIGGVGVAALAYLPRQVLASLVDHVVFDVMPSNGDAHTHSMALHLLGSFLPHDDALDAALESAKAAIARGFRVLSVPCACAAALASLEFTRMVAAAASAADRACNDVLCGWVEVAVQAVALVMDAVTIDTHGVDPRHRASARTQAVVSQVIGALRTVCASIGALQLDETSATCTRLLAALQRMHDVISVSKGGVDARADTPVLIAVPDAASPVDLGGPVHAVDGCAAVASAATEGGVMQLTPFRGVTRAAVSERRAQRSRRVSALIT